MMERKEKFKPLSLLALGVYLVTTLIAPVAFALGVPLTLPLVSVTSVTITPASPLIIVGNTRQFTATANFSDGSNVDVTNNASTTWSVDDLGVGTVNTTGLVSAVAAGNTNVNAQYLGVTGHTDFTVSNIVLTSVTVTPASSTFSQGQAQQYTAIATYSDASTVNITNDPGTVWSVTDSTLGSITNTGLFSAKNKLGSSTVTATYQTFTGTANFTVQAAAVSPAAGGGSGGSSSSSSGAPPPSPAPETTPPPSPAPETTPPPSPAPETTPPPSPAPETTPPPSPAPETTPPPSPAPETTPPPAPGITNTPEGQIPPPLPTITIPPFSPDTTPATVTLTSQPAPQSISEVLQGLLGQQFIPPEDGITRGEIVDRILKKFDIEGTKSELISNCRENLADCLSIFASYSNYSGLEENLQALNVPGFENGIFGSAHAQDTTQQADPQVLGATTVDASDFQLYPDTPVGTTFLDSINKATMLGIVNGYYEEPTSPFKPDRIVTRIEALKVLLDANDLMKWKYYSELEALLGGPDGIKNQKVPFNDVFPDRSYMWWYPRYINKACEVGIIACKQGTSFGPDEFMTKTEFSGWMNNLDDYFKTNDVPAILKGDPDLDTLPTYIEDTVYLTNPQSKDTDNDKLPDNEEVQQYHTSPFLTDTDADGLSDYTEVTVDHTDPLKVDTDGDGYSDGAEISAGTDPLDPNSFPGQVNAVTNIPQSWEQKYNIHVADCSQDTDSDGLSDCLEYQYVTDPTKADTDGDGFTDAEEILTMHTDPTDPNDPGPASDPATIEKLGARITNFIEGQLVADPQPLVKGLSPANAIVEIVLRNDYGLEKIIGQAVADQNNVFIFQVPQPIRDGKYSLVARALIPDKKEVLESPPVKIVIDSTLKVTPPAPRKLADQPVTDDNLLKDVRIEIRDQKPVLVGKTDFGSEVTATWRSIVVTSALIADTTTGDFSIQAPSNLGYGEHEVYVQAVRKQDNAMSKNIRLSFAVSPPLPGGELKPSAPAQSQTVAQAFSTFVQRQGFLFWLIMGVVALILIATGAYWFSGASGRKKK